MTPTDLETLRGLVELADKTTAGEWLWMVNDISGHSIWAKYNYKVADGLSREDAQFVQKAHESVAALTALLADYERMREWIPKAEHITGCEARKPMTYRILHDTYPDGEVPCICGLDALRATLKGEKHE